MIYTVRFGLTRIQTPEAGWWPVWTVPDDEHNYILRDIALWSEVGTTQGLISGVQSGGNVAWLLGSLQFPPASSAHLECRVALLPGDELQMYTSANSSSGVVFTGYRLGP